MAGFGTALPTKSKAEQMTPKRMSSAYKRLVKDGAVSIDVYCRGAAQGGDWLLVGRLAVAAPGTLMQAGAFQKRLILNHAIKISKKLKLARNDLEVGLQTPFKIAKLVRPADVPDDLDCGFAPELSQWLKYADDQGNPLDEP